MACRLGRVPLVGMRRSRRFIRLAAAAIAITGASLLWSKPSSAAPQCRFTMVSLTALDLQESGGDEIRIRLDGVGFPSGGSVTFTAHGQIRSAAAFGSPATEFPDQGASHLFVNVEEDDALFFDDGIGPTLGLTCTAGSSRKAFVFEDRTAAYRLTYDVESL